MVTGHLDSFGRRLLPGLFGCVLFAMGAGVRAQTNDLSHTAVPSLQIDSDVRSRAMGEVGVALPDLAHALGVNPALLLETEWLGGGVNWGEWRPEVSEDLSVDTRHLTLSGRGLGFLAAAGASYTKSNPGLAWQFDALGHALTQAPITEEVTSFGLAIAPHPNFSMGVTAKEVRSERPTLPGQVQVLDEWAYDGGIFVGGIIPQATFSVATPAFLAKLKLPYERYWQLRKRSGFSIGIAVRNLGEDVSYSHSSLSFKLPRMATVGLSYRPINESWLGVLFSAELQRPLLNKEMNFEGIMEGVGEAMWDAVTLQSDPGDVVRWGFELSLMHLLDLRLGHAVDSLSGRSPWTLGLGLGLDRLQLNWSHSYPSGDPKPESGTDFWGIALRF